MGWDIKKLGEKLKAKGLDIAEEALVVVVEESFDWACEEAVASENKMDDIVTLVLPAAKPYILGQIDKIDGEDDEGR